MSLRGCTSRKCAPFLCTPRKYSSGGILASAAAKCLPQNTQNSQNLLLGMVSHRFHRFTQMVRVRRFSHRIHRFHRTVCWGWSPTDFTDLHRWLGCVDSPTEFTDLLISGGALVSSAPTKQTVVLPQISQIYTEAANFRLVHFLLGWCTSYSVGALLALASGKAERRQVHPLEGTQTICVNLCNLWENILSKKFCGFCAICGRTFSARSFVNSVQSVGEHSQQEVL